MPDLFNAFRQTGALRQTGTPQKAISLRQSPASGQVRILLVDDNVPFRTAIYHLLKKLGYAVSVADGGKAALEVAARTKDIQLLITDLVMPGMNGVELAQKLQEADLRIAVLFISGHLGTIFTSGAPRKTIAPMGIPADAANFLQKPFDLTQLGNRVKTILAKRNEKEKEEGKTSGLKE